MGFLRSLLGLGPKVDYAEMILDGAKIIDVRTPREFKSGHPTGAINIPLNTIPNNLNKIKKYKAPVICVCASGNRSGQAVRTLKSQDASTS